MAVLLVLPAKLFAGCRLTGAAFAVPLLLGAIEVIQTHLPGRVAEITDPLLALILEMTLGHRSVCRTRAAPHLPR